MQRALTTTMDSVGIGGNMDGADNTNKINYPGTTNPPPSITLASICAAVSTFCVRRHAVGSVDSRQSHDVCSAAVASLQIGQKEKHHDRKELPHSGAFSLPRRPNACPDDLWYCRPLRSHRARHKFERRPAPANEVSLRVAERTSIVLGSPLYAGCTAWPATRQLTCSLTDHEALARLWGSYICIR